MLPWLHNCSHHPGCRRKRPVSPLQANNSSPVSQHSETRSHYTSWHLIAGKTLGWVSKQWPATVSRTKHSFDADGDRWAWAIHRHQAAGWGGLLQRKRRQTQRVYTSFITSTCYFQYAEWQFEIRISICTNDIMFIVYRLTSLLEHPFLAFENNCVKLNAYRPYSIAAIM